MAARYTEVTLEDMTRTLRRSFRVLRPRQGVDRGETIFDLTLSPNVFIRVWTSIWEGKTTAAGKKKDAIRVQIRSKKGRYSKAPIVKRTQNWSKHLIERIEDAMEKYEENEDYWESEAPKRDDDAPPPPDGVAGPPPSDKQVALAKWLVGEAPDDFDWSTYGLDSPPDEETLRLFSARSVSKMIDAIKAAKAGGASERVQPEPEEGVATFTKRKGKWCLRGMNLTEGAWVSVKRRDGSMKRLQVGRIIWRETDGTTIAAIATQSRTAAEEALLEDALARDPLDGDELYGTIPH